MPEDNPEKKRREGGIGVFAESAIVRIISDIQYPSIKIYVQIAGMIG